MPGDASAGGVPSSVREILSGAGKVLSERESKAVLGAFGIPVTREETARTAEEAVAIAGRIGYPVALKVDSPDILHKTEAGAIRLGVSGDRELREAFAEVLASARRYSPAARLNGVLVQEMVAPGGTEVIVGVKSDPQFGPVMMFGLGGIMVEVLKDVSFRLVPLEEKDAREMIDEIKGRPMLSGVRGQPPADIEALKRTILKVSEFVQQHPEVKELDLNPVFAYSDGALAVDARIIIDGA
ncbi:MAG: acetate--CoA ligase family protein [Dehalococcoidia bacterium]|nr:acetate--CoA ligase family protein [Dehalococcoidia bacterium]